ncbi:hypothetical protein CRE_08958 [Caenorhabditis remanei]|uniref:G-protein coupled receptors family 1 profile domain-containing protein n=1 Tax=Caenorhabditis remanei TaxID=31234 RepID=E3LIH0_CAERE|nr:hypothetical protein CRE_08958 [Caenorhabditis remanei]
MANKNKKKSEKRNPVTMKTIKWSVTRELTRTRTLVSLADRALALERNTQNITVLDGYLAQLLDQLALIEGLQENAMERCSRATRSSITNLIGELTTAVNNVRAGDVSNPGTPPPPPSDGQASGNAQVLDGIAPNQEHPERRNPEQSVQTAIDQSDQLHQGFVSNTGRHPPNSTKPCESNHSSDVSAHPPSNILNRGSSEASQDIAESFTVSILAYNSHISVVCGIINLFHLIILTRPAMRTSSVNLMMAAVAFFDICSLFQEFELFYDRLMTLSEPCLDTNTYASVLFQRCCFALTNYSRRYSTWVCLLIALIRTIVVRNPMSRFHENLTKPAAGYSVILGVFLASAPLGVLKLLEFQIEWTETISYCDENITVAFYHNRVSDLFIANNLIILNLFYVTDAVVSNVSFVNIYIDSKTSFQLIPCLLFPIVTFLLIREVRNVEQNRRRMFSSNKLSDFKKATRFVLYFTLTFSIAQFPFGLTSSVVYLFEETPGISKILYYLYNLFSTLFTASTVTHFIVCMLMSSQYRDTVKSVVSCGYYSKEKLCKSNFSYYNWLQVFDLDTKQSCGQRRLTDYHIIPC